MPGLEAFFCPDCGKLLFRYRKGGRAELLLWCRHCRSEKRVRLSGEDEKKNNKNQKTTQSL